MLKFKSEAEFAAWQAKAGLKSVEVVLPPASAKKPREPVLPPKRKRSYRKLAIGVLQGLSIGVYAALLWVGLLVVNVLKPLFYPAAGLFMFVLIVDLMSRGH